MNSCGQHRPAQGWEGVGHAEGLGCGEWGGTLGFYQFVATQKSTLLDVCVSERSRESHKEISPGLRGAGTGRGCSGKLNTIRQSEGW